MYCLKCGSVISDGMTFCAKCGTPVPAQPPVYLEPPRVPPYGVPYDPNTPMMAYGVRPPALDSKASGRAIAAIILGILSFGFGGPLLSIPAVILGKMEINAIRRGESSRGGETIAKVGYYSGLVNLIICGIFLLILVVVCGPILFGTGPFR